MMFCTLTAVVEGQDGLMGKTRDEVIDTLGKPGTEMKRGERVVAIFEGGVRVEFLDGVVVKTNSRSGANTITANDGTRYAASDEGKVRMIPGDEVATHAPPVTESTPAAAPPRTAAPKEQESEDDMVPEAVAEAGEAEISDEELLARYLPGDLLSEMSEEEKAEHAAALKDAIKAQGGVPPFVSLEKFLEDGGLKYEEPPPPPQWVRITSSVVGLIFQLGFTTLILSIAMRWVGLPYFMPDLIKTAILSVAVFEGVRSLGNLGGHWQWLQLFRAEQLLSFIALCSGLFMFKVVGNGLTALKIAIATKLVTYFLMIILGMAVTFGLASFY